jgi:hypothetical protein
MKQGSVIRNTTGERYDVEYKLWCSGPDDAGGHIRIGDDPMPGDRFMGSPVSAIPGDLTCVLETASGKKVRIFFTQASGTFVCQIADEAREALESGG